MTEEFQTLDVEDQLTRFSLADSAIAEMSDQYMPLTVAGLEDQAGYDIVRRARFDVRDKRIEVERVRKLLKADALAYGRKVDGEAKRITALLAPIESHLKLQEKPFDDEKDRIKNAARLKAEAEAAKQIADLDARIKAKQDAQAARLKAEREELDAERREMEAKIARIAADQKATQEKIDAERRAIEMEKAKAEAAEKEAALKAKAEAEERAEALRPDREKLLSVADAVKAIVVPSVSAVAQGTWDGVETILEVAETDIREIVKLMK